MSGDAGTVARENAERILADIAAGRVEPAPWDERAEARMDVIAETWDDETGRHERSRLRGVR